VRASYLSNASPVLSVLLVLRVERKPVHVLYVQPRDSTMALLEDAEAQEKVDAAHHNVYNMHTMGRAGWRW
jgi:hypothetical protein